MRRKDIFWKLGNLQGDIINLESKLGSGLYKLRKSNGGNPLFTSEEYELLKTKYKKYKNCSQPIGEDINRLLKTLEEGLADTTILASNVLHEAEIQLRKTQQEAIKYQTEIYYLQREITRYKSK